MDLFWRKGYHATSIQDVVETLGINRASLYDTYGDKHALFVKALERYQAIQLQSMLQLLQGPGGALEKIRVLLEMTAKAAPADREQKGCFLINAAMELVNQDPDVARMVGEHQRDMEQALEQLIRSGQNCGEMTALRDSRALARYVLCCLTGLRVTGKMYPDKSTLESMVQITINALQPVTEEAQI